MSLTIATPTDPHLNHNPPYHYSPSTTTTRSSYTYDHPKSYGAPLAHQPQLTSPRDMATTHRGLGLPPPSAMTLPDIGRGPHHYQQPQPPQLMRPPSPPPPTHHQNTDDLQKHWFLARAEEFKRDQELEKSRQEEIRLEQRKVDERMLHDSIRAGIPPHLIPIIFAGLGGGGMANGGFEMVQQYLSQFQQFQHTQQQSQHSDAPGLRREERQISRTDYDTRQQSSPQPTPRLHTNLPPQNFATVYPSPAHPSPHGRSSEHQNNGYGTITAANRPQPQAPLALLTSNEAQVQRLPSSITPTMGYKTEYQRSEHHPSQSPSTAAALTFHHYTGPPSGTNGTPKQHANPHQKTSPHLAGQVNGSEVTESPRKRKAAGGHHRNAPPSTAPKASTSPLSIVSNASAQRTHPASKGGISVKDHPFAPATGGRVPLRRESSSLGDTHAEENVRRLQSPPRRIEKELSKN